MDATPRIRLEELPEELRERLQARVDRLGYLGEFFQVAAHQPAPLASFIDLTEALKAALPSRVTEVIALTVAARTDNDYERVQHERLARKLGMNDREIKMIVGGHVLDDGAGFSAAESAAGQLAACIASAGGRGCPTAYERLATLEGPAFAVACLMSAARYLAHSAMVNTWALAPPEAVLSDGERIGV